MARYPTAKKRLPAKEREKRIVAAAVRFFAERGFEGQTRELAKRLGISQPLLYRYFPSKGSLIERVYQEVFVVPWKPEWAEWLEDRSVPIAARLQRFYQDYARLVLTPEWVRLFVFAGLKGLDLNRRFLAMLRSRVFERVIAELRFAHGLAPPSAIPIDQVEVELIWGLHATIFYLGTRRWIYGLAAPRDVEGLIAALVECFMNGALPIMAARLSARRQAYVLGDIANGAIAKPRRQCERWDAGSGRRRRRSER